MTAVAGPVRRAWLGESVICLLVATAAFVAWWMPFFLRGWWPHVEFGYSIIWGDWSIDRLTLVDKGVVPEWNPYVAFGENYIGRDGFNNPLSLGNLYKFAFRDPVAEWVFGLYLHLQILALGAYWLMRRHGVSRSAALVGALVLSMLPKWLDDGLHGPGKFVTAYSILPWAMLLIDRMYETRPRLEHFLWLGVAGAGIFLGSGAWVSIIVAYVLVPYFLVRLGTSIRRRSGTGEPLYLTDWIGPPLALVVALGLAAYMLLPLLDAIKHTQRSLYAPPVGYGLGDVLGFVFPWISRLYADGFYDTPLPIPSIARGYFGIAIVALFAYGLTQPDIRRHFAFFWILPTTLFCLFSKPALTVFPIADWFERALGAQSSENFLFIPATLCAIVFAAGSLDRLRGGDAPAWMRVAIRWLAAGYATVLTAWLTIGFVVHFFPEIPERLAGAVLQRVSGLSPNAAPRAQMLLNLVAYTYFFHFTFLLIAAGFVTRLLSLLWVGRSFAGKAPPLLALSLLLAADLLLIKQIWYPMRDVFARRLGEETVQNRFVAEHLSATDRIGTYYPDEKIREKKLQLDREVATLSEAGIAWDPQRYAAAAETVNAVDLGYFEPIFDLATTYYPATIGRGSYNYHISFLPDYFYDYERAMNSANPRYDRISWLALWNPQSRLIDIAGINYLAWYAPLQDKRLQEVAYDPVGAVHIYRNESALPRAYLAHSVSYWNDRQAMLSYMATGAFQPGVEVATEDPALAARVPKPAEGAGKDDVRILRYEPNAVELSSVSDRPGVLVLNDLFYPHWNAEVDGKPAIIHRVNGTFRGIFLEDGKHRIVMAFRNSAFHRGLVISAATLAAVLMLWVLSRIGRQHTQSRR